VLVISVAARAAPRVRRLTELFHTTLQSASLRANAGHSCKQGPGTYAGGITLSHAAILFFITCCSLFCLASTCPVTKVTAATGAPGCLMQEAALDSAVSCPTG